jgi:hypothetical protein
LSSVTKKNVHINVATKCFQFLVVSYSPILPRIPPSETSETRKNVHGFTRGHDVLSIPRYLHLLAASLRFRGLRSVRCTLRRQATPYRGPAPRGARSVGRSRKKEATPPSLAAGVVSRSRAATSPQPCSHGSVERDGRVGVHGVFKVCLALRPDSSLAPRGTQPVCRSSRSPRHPAAHDPFPSARRHRVSALQPV